MGVYTIFKELKDSLFMIIVGAHYLPDVKTLSLFLMIPVVLLYGWLSQRVKREKVLMGCLLIYGVGGIIITYFIQDPTIGLYNTVASKHRLFGWLFYLFIEGAAPFLVSALWSFFNSLSYPEDIKDNYIGMTSMSKLGGMFFSGSAYLYNTYYYAGNLEGQVRQYTNILLYSSIFLLFIPFLILFLVKNTLLTTTKGYSEEEDKKKDSSLGSLGLREIFKNKYIVGIFGLTFFWEVVNVIFNNLRLNIAFSEASSLCGITAILYKNIFFMHLFGLFFVLCGTKNIIKYLGVKVALLSIPLLTGAMIFAFLLFPSSEMVFFVYLVIRAINYTMTFPIKEALYIPTSRRIQFKTKSWIDGFGQKFSKGCGACYNKLLQLVSMDQIYGIQVIFFSIFLFLWLFSDYILGKQWEKIVREKKIVS